MCSFASQLTGHPALLRVACWFVGVKPYPKYLDWLRYVCAWFLYCCIHVRYFRWEYPLSSLERSTEAWLSVLLFSRPAVG